MKNIDTLRPDDSVTVTIFGPDNNKLYQTTGTGFHNVLTAIRNTVAEANLTLNPEDCVFEVANRTTEVTHRYRLNAHDNLKLIV